jgi:hypothetical protein
MLANKPMIQKLYGVDPGFQSTWQQKILRIFVLLAPMAHVYNPS